MELDTPGRLRPAVLVPIISVVSSTVAGETVSCTPGVGTVRTVIAMALLNIGIMEKVSQGSFHLEGTTALKMINVCKCELYIK